MIIDATDLILGRMAAVVAKKAIMGETVDIINCENTVITGTRDFILKKYQQKRAMGVPKKGPFYSRLADRFVRRSIRGMLSYKKPRGSEAYKRIMCYLGAPEKFNGKKIETIEKANISKVSNLKYITVGEICKVLGAKQ